MLRLLLGSAVVATLFPSVVTAQIPVSVASGVGSFGGGVQPWTPSLSAPVGPPYIPPFYGRGFYGGFHKPWYGSPGFGGFYPAYPYPAYPYPAFYGGGFVTSSFYSPYYVVPGPVAYDPPPPPAPSQPAFVVEVSGQLVATLVLQFPAPAEVWLDGQPVPGDPAAERTVTTPVLKHGERRPFQVRARWSAGGQTYEANREVTLGPGDRSRLLVVSGTAVSGR